LSAVELNHLYCEYQVSLVYDRFSDKGAHFAKWFEIAKNFLKLAFAGDRREAKCPCNRC
jgi:hypothetical protein